MELRHIRYFLALVAEKNFTRAAGKVGIAQSPFSAQIRDLEREVGAQLFHRVPHGAELTAAGAAFLKGVEAMPTLAEHASRAARRAARGEEGALSIGFTASSAFNAVVPTAIRTFHTAYPEVEVRLEEAITTRLAAGLREGSLDVAFLRPGVLGLEDLQLRPVSEEPLLAALPSSHPAAGDSEVTLAQLADDPLLLFPRQVGSTLYDTVVGAFRAAGIEPRLGQTAPQTTSIVSFVATGMGVALVPASMAQVAVADVVFRPVADTTLVVRLALATRRGETSPVVRNFLARALA